MNAKVLRAFLGEKQPKYKEGSIVSYKSEKVKVLAFCSDLGEYLVQLLTSSPGHIFVCKEEDF